MKTSRFRFPLLLMVFSILLLLVLQGLWIRAEYRAALDTFSRETNLVFRTTMHQVADSLFFSRWKVIPDTLHAPGRRTFSFTWVEATPDSLAKIAPEQISAITVVQPPKGARQDRQMVVDLRQNAVSEPNDTLAEKDTTANQGAHSQMRFMFNNLSAEINLDTLALLYLKGFNGRHDRLHFDILQKEFKPVPGGDRYRSFAPDTLPFTTSFVPIGATTYAIHYTNAHFFVWRKLIPQAGFASFVMLLMVVSFLLIYRNMQAQRRLLEHKNAFIGNMTHELKTPVATVGVALEALKRFDVLQNPTQAMDYLDMASHELNRLSLMTDKILKTAVVDYQQEIRQYREWLSLRLTTLEVIASFRLLAEGKKIQLKLQAESPCELQGHSGHLAQMIYNLLDNALRYASNSPEVLIRIAEDAEWVWLEVADQGPGIHESHHRRIFEKFYRVPSGNVHTVKGYGLGLHYVEGVVKAHGGRIQLESAPGQGARFIIKLPKHG